MRFECEDINPDSSMGYLIYAGEHLNCVSEFHPFVLIYMSTKNTLFWVLNIFIPLFIGGIIYVICCPETYISQFVFAILNIEFKIDQSIVFSPFYKFMRYWGLDMLWAYALAVTVGYIIGRGKKQLLISFIVCVIFAILIEFFQKIKLFDGTFDYHDIVFEIVAIFIGILIQFFKFNIIIPKGENNL